MSLPLGITVGDYVEITTTSRPELNNQLWMVHDEQPHHGRVTLRPIGPEQQDQLISVKHSAVHPVALVLAHVPLPADADVATLQRFLGADGAHNGSSERRFSFARVNQWICLPGLGGNSVMLKEAGNPNQLTNVMYPGLQGYELWFYSAWAQEVIQLVDCDILKLCPACHVWPWCAWCHRFLFPPEAHRGSRRHFWCRQACLTALAEAVRMDVIAQLPPARMGVF